MYTHVDHLKYKTPLDNCGQLSGVLWLSSFLHMCMYVPNKTWSVTVHDMSVHMQMMIESISLNVH